MFESRCNLTYCQTWETTRQFQETFRKVAMEKVLGKVQMLGSHITCGIRVNSAVLKVDRAGSRDEYTSTL